jgi:hypothetical protein
MLSRISSKGNAVTLLIRRANATPQCLIGCSWHIQAADHRSFCRRRDDPLHHARADFERLADF